MRHCLSPTNRKKNKTPLSPATDQQKEKSPVSSPPAPKKDTSPLLSLFAPQKEKSPLLSLLAHKKDTSAVEAKNHISEGLGLMRKGNYNEALKMFQQAASVDKEYAAAYTHQARVLERSGKKEDKEQILMLYTQAIQLNPDDLMARYGMSCIKEAQGDINSAAALREEIVSHKAKTVSDHQARALCSGQTNKFLGFLEDAAKFERTDPSVHFMAAQYYFAKKDYKHSLKFIEKALKIDKEYVDALALKGDILYKTEGYLQSLDSYDAALKINPHDLHSLTNKAEELYKIKEYKKSLEISNQIIKIESDNHLAYSYIATSLYGMKNFSEGLDAINKSIELAPGEVLYFCIRAKIFMALHNRNHAVKDLNEAYRLHNDQTYQKDDNVEDFVLNSLEERKKLIESLAKLSSPSLDTMYGAEEKHNEAKTLHNERKNLINEALEKLGAPEEETSIIQAKLNEKTALVLKLEQEISQLRKEKNADLLEQIEKSVPLSNYLEGFSHTWSQTYTASQSVASGIIKINTYNLGVSVASAIVSLVPFCGDALSTITQMTGDFLIKANILQHANNFAQIAPNHTRLDIIAEAVGMRAAVHYNKIITTPSLLQPKAMSWWQQVIDTINKISDKLEETAFGQLYSTHEARLGHYHASKLIGEISTGRFEISPKDTLPDRLFGLLTAMDDNYDYIIPMSEIN